MNVDYQKGDLVCTCKELGRTCGACTESCKLLFRKALTYGHYDILCFCREHITHYTVSLPINTPHNSWPSFWKTNNEFL